MLAARILRLSHQQQQQIMIRLVRQRTNPIRKTSSMPSPTTSHSASVFQKEAQKFMEKHAKRGTPQSPYMLGLTYKVQLTSALSLTHRVTGVGLGLILYGFGMAELINPNRNYAQLLESYWSYMPSFGPDVLKFLCGTALAFHTFNGVRHLCWDMGYGFTLQKLYLSGYIVLGLTTVFMLAYLVNTKM